MTDYLSNGPQKTMHKKFLSCIIIVVSFMLSGSLGAETAGKVQVTTEQQQGQTVSLKVGEKWVLEIRNPGSGGYSQVTPVYDQAILKLAATEKIPRETTPKPLMGDFGKLRFSWEALKAGETEVLIRISRPWEKDVAPLEFTKNRVVVAE